MTLEGLGWRLSQPTSAAIARHAMALILNAAKTSHSASLGSEASNLLQLIGRRIEARMPDYGVSILASPSMITFASVRGSLGLLPAVAAFGRAMGKQGIIIVATLGSAMAGHQDGGKIFTQYSGISSCSVGSTN